MTENIKDENCGQKGLDDNNVCEASNDSVRDKQQFVDTIAELVKRGRGLGLSEEEIRQSFLCDRKLPPEAVSKTPNGNVENTLKTTTICAINIVLWKSWSLLRPLLTRWNIFVVVSAIVVGISGTLLKNHISQYRCLVPHIDFTSDLWRHEYPCHLCENLTQIPEVTSLTEEELEKFYGFTTVPVIVRGAAKNWRALDTFSYDFIRSLYLKDPKSLEVIKEYCQFIGLNTEFYELEDVFKMSPARANFSAGERPWYLGWSNCDEKVGKELAKHFEIPAFTGNSAHSTSLIWIFMGGPGVGVGLHVDTMYLPSWQAQITGSKTWRLVPSIECSAKCPSLEFLMERGDLIVLDTNVWHHATVIQPGNISITVGKEFI